jgi:hypothetical protein
VGLGRQRSGGWAGAWLFLLFFAFAPVVAAGDSQPRLRRAESTFHAAMWTGPGLVAVSCATTIKCEAVGEKRSRHGPNTVLAERWDGSRWSVERTPSPSRTQTSFFIAVSCPSPRACVAVGGDTAAQTVAESLVGRRWSIQKTGILRRRIGGVLNGVSCTSARACVAVGGSDVSSTLTVPLVERWHGRRWSVQTVPRPAHTTGSVLNSVSCSSRRSCTAVGSATPVGGNLEPLAERWDGRRWSIERTPNPAGSSTLLAVSCPMTSGCLAAGWTLRADGSHRQLVERWNGSAWFTEPLPGPRGVSDAGLNDVSCSSVDACTTVGWAISQDTFADGPPPVERLDGNRWSIQPTPKTRGGVELEGVSCPSPVTCTAIGPVAERWDGTLWSIEPTPR